MFETKEKSKRNRRFSGFGGGTADRSVVASLPSSPQQQQRHQQQQQHLAASFSPKIRPVSGVHNRSTSVQNGTVPFFGMILDRTSFDEADDFRVNQEEIQNKLLPPSTRSNLKRSSDGTTNNNEKSTNGSANFFFQSSPPTIMANGKVRRRLKWRPRSPKKNKIPPPTTKSHGFAGNRFVSSPKQENASLNLHMHNTDPMINPEPGHEMSTTNTTAYERQQPQEQQQLYNNTQLSHRDRQQNRVREDRRASSATHTPTGTIGSSFRFPRTTSKDYNNNNNNSCGGSVRSRLSVHSFASTETKAVSNKKRDKVSRYTPSLSSTIIEYETPVGSSSFWTNQTKSPVAVDIDDVKKVPIELSDENQMKSSEEDDSGCTSIFSVPLSVEVIEGIDGEAHSNAVVTGDCNNLESTKNKYNDGNISSEVDCNDIEVNDTEEENEEDDEFVELDTLETDSMSVSVVGMARSGKSFPSLFTASSSSSSLRSSSVRSVHSDTSSRQRRIRVPFSSRFGRQRNNNHNSNHLETGSTCQQQRPSPEIICYTPKPLTTSVSFPGLSTVSSPVFSISKKAKTNLFFTSRKNNNRTYDPNDDTASLQSAPGGTNNKHVVPTTSDPKKPFPFTTSIVGEEEVEQDRRVDLRIVRSNSNWSSNHKNQSSQPTAFDRPTELIRTTTVPTKINNNKSISSSCTDEQLIQELRSCSFADATTTRTTTKTSCAVSKMEQTPTNESNDNTVRHNNNHDEESIQSSSHNNKTVSSELIIEETEEDIEIDHTTAREHFPMQTSLYQFLPIPFKSVVSELFTTTSSPTMMMSTTRRCSSFSEQRSAPMILQSFPTTNTTSEQNTKRVEEGEQFYEVRFSMSKQRTTTTNKDNVVASTLLSSSTAQEMQQERQDNEESCTDISVVAGTTPLMDDDSRDNTLPTDRIPSPIEDVVDVAFLEAEKNLLAIEEVAMEHLQQGEYTEALDTFQEILRGLLTRYGECHFRVGTAVHNIGVVHMKRGDYTKAQVAYKEAIRVRKLVLDPDHPDVAVSLAQLGMAYLETNRHQAAIGAFRESLKIRRKCFGNYHPKVAKVLNNIGCALYELDELDVARVAFEEALDIQRRVLQQQQHTDRQPNKDDRNGYKHADATTTSSVNHDDNVKIAALLSIASTQSNIASIKLYHGELDAALVDLEEALILQENLLGEHHELVRRTKESLVWLERHSCQQQQQQQQQSTRNNHGGPKNPITYTSHTNNNNNDGNKNNGDDPHIRVQDILAQLGPLSAAPQITTTNLRSTTSSSHNNGGGLGMHSPPSSSSSTSLTTPFDHTKNSVLGSLERGLRMFHADLDYMACAKIE